MPTDASPTLRADRMSLAVTAIVVTVAALSLGDALVKLTSNAFGLWQIFLCRSAIVLPVLVGYLATRPGGLSLRRDGLGWIALRCLMLVAMWVLYYLSLPHLTLSVAAAGYYTLPIFITLFSALFLGERISGRGWLAVVAGFAGVLLVLRPEAGQINPFALLPLGSAMLYAGAMIVTRSKCREVEPVVLAASLNVGFVLTGAIGLLAVSAFAASDGTFLTMGWIWPEGTGWITLLVMALSILIGNVGNAIAYQNGRPSVIGSFDFAYVGFAVLWGMLFFGDIPDALTTLGIGTIVAAGVLALRS
ncbi:DMT family transporter [Pseudooceanicola sp. C21-150M6]|uniref:DMT family transporter n=1 Tax=Pseudooceanicola sp. C21-150M6 TaxID=3434355 RepID=UPI003D7FD22F